MKYTSRSLVLMILWIFTAAGAVGLGCGGTDDCPAGQVAGIKFGATPQEGCVFTCLNSGNCPNGEFCTDFEFTLEGICKACSPENFPEGGAFECDSNEDCVEIGSECIGCQCTPGEVLECPVVDVAPGTVPFDGACDQDADCADELPCIDCVCL